MAWYQNKYVPQKFGCSDSITSDFCTHFSTDARYTSSSLVRYDVLSDSGEAGGLVRVHEGPDAAHCINTDPFTRFFICQPEQCPDTGKLHVQYYVEFQSPKALSVAKAI